ncbi:MAG TPA: IS1182 family transposase [bacterium]|nr:IS1182 family transposase [bacterium]
MPSIKAKRNQMYLLPPVLDDWILSNHPARFIVCFVESLDLKQMGFKQAPEEGRPPYDNDMLLSIWLYGLMKNVRSTRKLENSLYDSIAMKWITGDERPDHNTLWRFFNDNRDKIKEVFKGTVNMAIDYKMVGFELQAIDGTRIMADVNNDKTITEKGQKKRLVKIEKEIEAIMSEIEKSGKEAEENGDSKNDYGIPKELLDKEEMRKAIKASLEMLKKEGQKEKNPTDKEARFMKVRGAGIKQGYNAQAVVDSKNQIITGAELNNISSDSKELTKMIKEAEKNTETEAKETLVDKGYYSAEEIAKAAELKKNVIISFANKSKKGKFAKSNFKYNKSKDEYICPEGKRLTYGGAIIRKDRGNKKEYTYICRDYCDCKNHKECTKSKRGRVIKTINEEQLINEMKERAAAENWKEKLKARGKIVEPIFAHVKERLGLRRFSVRGMYKAKVQWFITCAVYNLKKIYGYQLNYKARLRLPET